MRVVIQYRAGEVPQAEAAANQEALWEWVEQLQDHPEHEQTVAVGEGRTISGDSDTAYAGEVFGISVLQVDSLEMASALLADWPEFAYGGHLDILPELSEAQ